MASSAKTFVLLFLLTFLSSHQILARESQFFNKIPRNTNNNNDVVTEFEPVKQEQEEPLNYKPDQQEPNFLPENESNGYGLYGHESAQLPSSTTAAAINVGEPFKTPTPTTNNNNFPNSKYLPKNYNTEAYVTEPEGYTTTTTTTVPENNNFPNSKYLPKNYNTESYVTEPEGYNFNGMNGNFNNYQQQQEERNNYYNGQNGNFKQEGYSNSEATGSNNYGAGFAQKGYNNNYYDGQNSNFKQEGYSTSEATGNNNYGAGLSQRSYTTTAGGGSRNNYNYYNGGNSNQKQGMSDTRFLEDGKYYYDVNRENTRGFGNNQINSYDQYNNNNNAAMEEGYQNQQFQNFHDEVGMP